MTMMKIKGAIYLWNALYLAAWLATKDAGFVQYLNVLGTLAFGVWLERPSL